MSDREFVHSTIDVASTLLFALDSGMQVIVDTPQLEPRPQLLSLSQAAKMEKGVFYLFRPEWVSGSFHTMMISSGYNKGKYFVQPRTNYTAITASFHGERIEQGLRKLGCAIVSHHRDWLELPAKIVRPAPPDAKEWFKRIVSHLSSGVIVRAGVHKYHICKGVLADHAFGQCLPPFDFIPWDESILKTGEK
ncbi:MAG: hypothetical protein HZA51_10845 [Planctomycetes bacterium]|nr:hypothetical protein [Planctomycetota bacterium]